MSLRENFKISAGLLNYFPVVFAPFQKYLRSTYNILYYHYIGPNRSFYKDFYVGATPERFNKDLKYLRRLFDFTSLENIISCKDNSKKPYKPRLAITFDDGFNIAETEILQVLRHHQVKATIFLLTSCIDNKSLMWRNKLSAVRSNRPESRYLNAYNNLMEKMGLRTIKEGSQLMDESIRWPMHKKEDLADELWRLCDMPSLAEYLEQERPYLDWKGIELLIEEGHSVGLHTHSHPLCSKLNHSQIKDEIVNPAAILKKRLNLNSLPFSYPFGDRLPKKTEQSLYQKNIFSCALGIRGFSPIETPLPYLERVSAEGNIRFALLGNTLKTALNKKPLFKNLRKINGNESTPELPS